MVNVALVTGISARQIDAVTMARAISQETDSEYCILWQPFIRRELNSSWNIFTNLWIMHFIHDLDEENTQVGVGQNENASFWYDICRIDNTCAEDILLGTNDFIFRSMICMMIPLQTCVIQGSASTVFLLHCESHLQCYVFPKQATCMYNTTIQTIHNMFFTHKFFRHCNNDLSKFESPKS